MKKNIKKSITFIYTEKIEYSLYLSIEKSAKERGYDVKYSNNIFAKDDIVIYCQHDCYPCHNSKLSLVMLHDLGQQHGLWPNIWIRENWNKFDIGLLPNKEWVKMWNNASICSLANPKIGCFEVGWPKSDMVVDSKFEIETQNLADKIGLNRNLRTVLYAPSWENDNKQLEFVESLENVNVNMLIKHYPLRADNKDERPIIENVKRMARICKNKERVYILNPETNIFLALALADILVSDESSTLLEAMLFGRASVSVVDWLVYDNSTGSWHFPTVPYEFVIKTKKRELKNTLLEILNDFDAKIEKVITYRDSNYINIGKAGKRIIDIVEYCINEDNASLSRLKLEKKTGKYKYPVKARIKYFFRECKVYLASRYRNPDSNIIIHGLYLLYKKCLQR
jgi:hypothetical protein